MNPMYGQQQIQQPQINNMQQRVNFIPNNNINPMNNMNMNNMNIHNMGMNVNIHNNQQRRPQHHFHSNSPNMMGQNMMGQNMNMNMNMNNNNNNINNNNNSHHRHSNNSNISNSNNLHQHHQQNNNNQNNNKGPTKETWVSPFSKREQNIKFFMYAYKCQPCGLRRGCSSKVTCPGWHHEGEKRRNPGEEPDFVYSEEPCPNVKPQGSNKWQPPARCKDGDVCHYSHTLLEQMYHPNIYKTSMCINFTNPAGNKCQWGFYCTHAHGQDDTRSNKSTPNSNINSSSTNNDKDNAINNDNNNGDNNNNNSERVNGNNTSLDNMHKLSHLMQRKKKDRDRSMSEPQPVQFSNTSTPYLIPPSNNQASNNSHMQSPQMQHQSQTHNHFINNMNNLNNMGANNPYYNSSPSNTSNPTSKYSPIPINKEKYQQLHSQNPPSLYLSNQTGHNNNTNNNSNNNSNMNQREYSLANNTNNNTNSNNNNPGQYNRDYDVLYASYHATKRQGRSFSDGSLEPYHGNIKSSHYGSPNMTHRYDSPHHYQPQQSTHANPPLNELPPDFTPNLGSRLSTEIEQNHNNNNPTCTPPPMTSEELRNNANYKNRSRSQEKLANNIYSDLKPSSLSQHLSLPTKNQYDKETDNKPHYRIVNAPDDFGHRKRFRSTSDGCLPPLPMYSIWQTNPSTAAKNGVMNKPKPKLNLNFAHINPDIDPSKIFSPPIKDIDIPGVLSPTTCAIFGFTQKDTISPVAVAEIKSKSKTVLNLQPTPTPPPPSTSNKLTDELIRLKKELEETKNELNKLKLVETNNNELPSFGQSAKKSITLKDKMKPNDDEKQSQQQQQQQQIINDEVSDLNQKRLARYQHFIKCPSCKLSKNVARDQVLVPCGHLICNKCQIKSIDNHKCPLCDQIISQYQKLLIG